MPTLMKRATRVGALSALAALSTACGGGTDPLPQLGAATPASLSGACDQLSSALAGFPAAAEPGFFRL